MERVLKSRKFSNFLKDLIDSKTKSSPKVRHTQRLAPYISSMPTHNLPTGSNSSHDVPPETLLNDTVDTGTDIAKITRKWSKPDKHGHGNGKSAQEPEVF
ncbi:hypothetical protein Tco_0040863 [Tanacetum coccineum]